MRIVTLEDFEKKLNNMSEDEILEYLPKKIYNTEEEVDHWLPVYWKLWWTEDKVEYYYWFKSFICIPYYKDFKNALIKLAAKLVEKKYINLTEFF